MKLGNAIKIIRKQIGMSQAELSNATGISQTSISKIERGANPNETNLKKISKVLKVTPSLIYVLSLEETDVPKDKKDKYRHLFPVIQNLALEIVGHDDKAT